MRQNNLTIRKPVYESPVVHVIMNFKNRHLLFAIVDDTFTKDIFDLAHDPLHTMKFFGYAEQCQRQWFKHPGRVVKLKVPLKAV